MVDLENITLKVFLIDLEIKILIKYELIHIN